jgi:hypothetical protein
MIISFLIATLILFSMNLLLVLISMAQQYGNNPIQPFQVMSLTVLLIMITWNILSIVYV